MNQQHGKGHSLQAWYIADDFEEFHRIQHSKSGQDLFKIKDKRAKFVK